MRDFMKLFLSLSAFAALSACGSSGSSSSQPAAAPVVGPASIPEWDAPDSIRAIGAIARDSNGKALKMSYVDAYNYCHNQGSRLPTIREAALLAVANGAKGIRETAFPDISLDDHRVKAEEESNRKDQYFVKYRRSLAGQKVVAFYLNESGEEKASKDAGLGRSWFWSSPVPCGGDDSDGAYSVSAVGFVCKDLRDVGLSDVRCVVN